MFKFLFSRTPKQPSRDALRREVTARLIESLPDMRFEQGQETEDHLTMSHQGGEPSSLYLGKLLSLLETAAETDGAEDAKEESIQNFIDMARKTATQTDAAQDADNKVDLNKVYLALRHCDLLQSAQFLHRQGPGDCVIAVLQDFGSHIGTVPETDDDAASLIWQAAERNLIDIQPFLALFDMGQGIEAISFEEFDWLSSGVLLMPGIFHALMERDGAERILIAAPSRISVLCTTEPFEEVGDALAQMMAKDLEGGYALSDFLYELTPDEMEMRPTYQLVDGMLKPVQ